GWVCRMPALQAGWPSLRDGFLRAAPAFTGLRPRTPMQGEVSPCEPLWPASQLFPRLPKPIEHTRPRGIHAPGHSFGVIQTMLLALANFGLERMGRKKPQQFAKLMRPAAGYFLLVFGFWFLVFGFWFLVCAKRTKNGAGVAAAVLSAPIARRNEASLTGPPGWTGRGSWRTMRLTIRGRRQ